MRGIIREKFSDVVHFRVEKRQFLVIPTFGFTNEYRARYIAFAWMFFFLSIKLYDRFNDCRDWIDEIEDYEMEDDA